MNDKVTISVRCTGEIFSIAASQYEITFPDGTTETCWSGPWNDYTHVQEDAGALKFAAERWFSKMGASEIDETVDDKATAQSPPENSPPDGT